MNNINPRAAFASVALLALAGCASVPATPAPHRTAPLLVDPPFAADVFMARLNAHCGKAYAGRLVSDPAADPDMAGVGMIMHVRNCSAEEVRIPFPVQNKDGSWDRSRTWVTTRTAKGLRLKHDHRHADGSPDAVTMYGGDTPYSQSAGVQHFHVDSESIAMFRANGLDKSVTNIWTIEVSGPDDHPPRFVYALTRDAPHARRFRVEFDLSREVAAPPPPWGSK